MAGNGDEGQPKRIASRRTRGVDPWLLLAWYDRNRRDLPWRAPPGAAADPYKVWLSEIMLQQTTVTTVAPVYAAFVQRFPTVEALAAAPLAEVLTQWAGLGYYARARNLHACARLVVEHHGGCFPRTEQDLAGLPGIGPCTAAAVAAIAFGERAVPIDGNVARVLARIFAIEEPLPGARARLRRLAARLAPERRPGDFAQALMDLGAIICRPKRPACADCPWAQACAACRRGEPEAFPRRRPKATGALRRGAAFVAIREDGCVLLQHRPPKGLLGGMAEVPTTHWVVDFRERDALVQAPRLTAPSGDSPGRAGEVRWRRRSGVVSHAFTHFPLELVVYVARVPVGAVAPPGARWVAPADLAGEALPALMRKVIAHGVGSAPIAPRSAAAAGSSPAASR